MQIHIDGKTLLRRFGFVIAGLFWLALIFVILSLSFAGGDSGAAYVIMGIMFLMMKFFPLMFVPIGILVYGMRKDHALPLVRSTFKWGTIATAVYLAILLTVMFFMLK